MRMDLKAMILAQRARRQIRKQAEQVLTQRTGMSISLRFLDFIRLPSVCHLQVLAGPIELGDSLIIKGIRRRENHTGFETSYPATQWMFFNDWASLQFLQREALSAEISPRLFAAAHQPALLVIEDLKPFAHLGTFLQDRDAHQATEALIQWGIALGKLHASTIGKLETFNTLREVLAPRMPSWGWVPPWQREPGIYRQLLESVPPAIRGQGFESFQWMPFALRQTCEALSLPLPSHVEVELGEVMRALRSPDPFLAYSHGDPCSENCLFTKQGFKFVDFENGMFRHALFDAVYPRMGFPTCWNGQQIPLAVVEQIEQHYRTTVIMGCPEAADDRLFAQALVYACTYWVLLPCQFHALRRLTTHDPSFCPIDQQTRIQQCMLFRFERLAQTTAETGYLQHLGNLFHMMGAALRKRWPVQTHQLPLYPAFEELDPAHLQSS